MHQVILWLCYLVGGCLSMWKRASLSAASPHTPWYTVREYVISHAPALATNLLLSTCLFAVWWQEPAFVGKMLGFVGFKAEVELPLNFATAAIYGVFSDVAMDWVVAKLGGKFTATQPVKP